MKHEFKTLPEFFQAAWVQDKTFEIRDVSDRPPFKERDEIVLQEWDPEDEAYTGRQIEGVITYITAFDQRAGRIVFSYRPTLFSE